MDRRPRSEPRRRPEWQAALRAMQPGEARQFDCSGTADERDQAYRWLSVVAHQRWGGRGTYRLTMPRGTTTATLTRLPLPLPAAASA